MDDKWIKTKLEKIAVEAWKSNSRNGDKKFLLSPPDSGLGLDGLLARIYDHARVWTPGLRFHTSFRKSLSNPFLMQPGNTTQAMGMFI
jgi:hypothetical protein